MSLLGRLACAVSGHAGTEREETGGYVLEVCDRCGKAVDRGRSYEGAARRGLPRWARLDGYRPVRRAERGEKALEPGDRLLYLSPSAFPGMDTTRTGTVEYLYETPSLGEGTEYSAKVGTELELIPERRWAGARPADSLPAPEGGRLVVRSGG